MADSKDFTFTRFQQHILKQATDNFINNLEYISANPFCPSAVCSDSDKEEIKKELEEAKVIKAMLAKPNQMETTTTSGIIQTTFPKLDVIHNLNGMPGTMALAELSNKVEIFFLMPSVHKIDDKRAKELKKRWNLHPELVDVLQVINEQIEHTGSITISKTSVIDTAIKMMLKQAEE